MNFVVLAFPETVKPALQLALFPHSVAHQVDSNEDIKESNQVDGAFKRLDELVWDNWSWPHPIHLKRPNDPSRTKRQVTLSSSLATNVKRM